METSVLLAQIIGPTILILGIGILMNLGHYRRLVDDFAASPFQIFFAGLLSLLFGILIVCFHNVWEWRWPVMITIIGWILLLRGILGITAPGFIRTIVERYPRNTFVLGLSALTAVVVAAILTYFAFVHYA